MYEVWTPPIVRENACNPNAYYDGLAKPRTQVWIAGIVLDVCASAWYLRNLSSSTMCMRGVRLCEGCEMSRGRVT